MDYIIYHNPRCRKSRETLNILQEKGIAPRVIKYLENPLKAQEVLDLSQLLGIEASQLLRKNETLYKEHFKGQKLSPEEAADAIEKFPKLMERPVVVAGKKAIIGRPPEKVLEIL